MQEESPCLSSLGGTPSSSHQSPQNSFVSPQNSFHNNSMSPHQSPHYTSVTHQKSPHYASPSPHPPPIKPHPNTTGGSPANYRTSPRHPSAPRQQQQSSSYQCDPSQQRWNPLEKNKVKKNLPGVTPPLLICPNQNLLKVAPSCKDRVQVNGGGPGRAPLHQVQDRKKKMDLTEHFPLLPFPALPIKGAEKGRSMKGKIWKSIDKKNELLQAVSLSAIIWKPKITWWTVGPAQGWQAIQSEAEPVTRTLDSLHLRINLAQPWTSTLPIPSTQAQVLRLPTSCFTAKRRRREVKKKPYNLTITWGPVSQTGNNWCRTRKVCSKIRF